MGIVYVYYICIWCTITPVYTYIINIFAAILMF